MLTHITPPAPDWDAFVHAHPRAHILQAARWADLKGAHGWRSDRVALVDGGRIVAGAQLLFRPLPFRLGSLAYVAMAPLLTAPAHEKPLWDALHRCAKRHGAAFLRCEPGIFAAGERPPDLAALGFRETDQTIQPPRTVILDISGDDDAILARMNQGTRRKIRQSIKPENGVRYSEGSRGDMAKFNALMQVTGSRNDFGVHAPGYYDLAYDLFVPHDAALLLAEHEGDVLAGIMVFALGRTAWYLYGASSNDKRNLMATYGIQWTAIQWAKRRGCTHYDLWGIPDAPPEQLEAEFEARSDGLWGVYGFKRGWGGEIVRSLGAWDNVYNPIIYAAYQWAVKRRDRSIS